MLPGYLTVFKTSNYEIAQGLEYCQVDLAAFGTSLAALWTSVALFRTFLVLFWTSVAAFGTSNA